MACVLVPAAEAVIVSLAVISLKVYAHHHEKNASNREPSKVRALAQHLSQLCGMLWGGSALLALEHIWHGEIVPFYPFLTAVKNPEDTQAMLHEMAVSGTAMALVVTLAWAGMLVVQKLIKHYQKSQSVNQVNLAKERVQFNRFVDCQRIYAPYF